MIIRPHLFKGRLFTDLLIFECLPVFLGKTSTKQMQKCLAQRHNAVPLVSL